MGRKNRRNRGSNGQVAQPKVPPTSTPVPTSGQQEIDQKQNRKIDWAMRLSIFSAVTAFIGVITTFAGVYWTYRATQAADRQADYSAKQTTIAEAALDLTTGKRSAKIEFADFYPLPEDTPEQRMTRYFNTDKKVPFFRNPTDLVINGPLVWLNNIGDDPIETIRLETSWREGVMDTRNLGLDLDNPPKEWFKNEVPVVLKKTEREEFTPSKNWGPGKAVEISVMKGILSQMAQAQSKKYLDRMQYARIEFGITAKLAGSSIFSSEEVRISWMVAWLPSAFTEDEVKRVLDNYQKGVIVSDKRPIRKEIPRGALPNMFDGVPNLGSPKR